MIDGLVGRKIGMSQLFQPDGRVVAVTAIEVGPCVVVEARTPEKHGYAAVQLGFGEETKRRRLTKPVQGRFRAANVTPKRWLKEVRTDPKASFAPGTVIGLDGPRGLESELAAGAAAGGSSPVFAVGERITVVGQSKGKGFQGVVRRHKFNRGPMSHGSRFHRYPGAIGCRTDPGKVGKGKRMPGHMGDRRVSQKNLEVVHVDPAANLLLVRGAVPGAVNGLVFVLKNKAYIK